MVITSRSSSVRGNVPPVVGHRGVAGHAPENTLAGFRKAAEMGVFWVEFDVMLLGDGTPVLIHDETLARTTDGVGRVHDLNIGHLDGLDAGSWFSPEFKGERIPTLDEAMTELERLGMGANVEIKPSVGFEDETGDVVAQRISKKWPATLPTPVISSFSGRALRAFRAKAPGVDMALLLWEVPGDWRERAEILGVSALHCSHKKTTEAQMRAMIDAGYPVRVYTVNDAGTADRMKAWGASTLFTDYPDRI